MSHTYTANYFHCVFFTKERQNTIPEELKSKLWAYFAGIAKNLGLVTIAVILLMAPAATSERQIMRIYYSL